MKDGQKIAMLMPGLSCLRGGGGVERFYADVMAEYGALDRRRLDVRLVIDESSIRQLEAAGRALPPGRVIALPGSMGRWQAWRLCTTLLRLQEKEKFRLWHLPFPKPQALPFLWTLSTRRERPRLSLGVVAIPELILGVGGVAGLRSRSHRRAYLLYQLFLRTVPFDGLYTWYRAFKERHRARPGQIVRSARYCFVDVRRCRPAPHKENLIVFAGRLVEEKRPLLFLDAVARAVRRAEGGMASWRFEMHGRGVLEQRIRKRLRELRLEQRLRLTESDDMVSTFARSRVFVSTQDHENFTSLSMLEAMACENAVVARDVGQSRDFARPGINAVLSDSAEPDAIADALLSCIRDDDALTRMGAEGRRIAVEEHCVENFLNDIEAYFTAVLASEQRAPPVTADSRRAS